MKRRSLIKGGLATLSSLYMGRTYAGDIIWPSAIRHAGPFQPSWESLGQYNTPEWFRDAKFGIWAHWGPQCQPERGDWYARGMYQEGSDQYKYHCEKYGHPSVFGFKDVINQWKAEKWEPDTLLALYKKAGARYFVALANHHDNFDNFDSRHQPWNSTKIGPRKDLIGGWAEAAKSAGLPFGVSVHASHAWHWYEPAQLADKHGPLAGVPYDGRLQRVNGAGKWWNGLDPQQLYAQNHPLSDNSRKDTPLSNQWDWGNGAFPPSKAYCEKFYNRVIDLIENYDPELVYFDDTALPLWPVSDAGLRIAAHLYNRSIKKYGQLRAVLNGKVLNEQQRKCMVWDIERGQSNAIEPLPWQTDTCIGEWHYDRRVYERNGYKTSTTVIHTLIDVVSKNGNLLLNVPLRGDGSMDEKERVVVDGIADWMALNSEAIYGTRPWKIFGEGPATESAAPLNAQGFNEGKGKPFTAQDIRFTTKDKTLYAILLGWPTERTTLIRALGAGSGKVVRIQLLGASEALSFTQTPQGLQVSLPDQPPCKDAFVLKIDGFIV